MKYTVFVFELVFVIVLTFCHKTSIIYVTLIFRTVSFRTQNREKRRRKQEKKWPSW